MVIARKEPQIDLAGKAENTSFRQLVAAAFSFEQSSDAATHGQQLGHSGRSQGRGSSTSAPVLNVRFRYFLRSLIPARSTVLATK
jgi:hypothetical protein